MAKCIRSATPADAAAIAAIYAPYVTDLATSFEIVAPDAAEMARRVEMQQETHPWLVFERDGRIQGYAYASSHQPRAAYKWSVNVSVYVDAGVQRSGIGRALYSALFELLRRQRYANAYAGITLPNAASMGLHKAMGFEPVGVFRRVGFKFGQWHDVAWVHLPLLDASAAGGNLLAAPSLWADPAIGVLLNQAAVTARD